MTFLSSIYKTSSALLTDLYQLTMAYGYYVAQKADQEAVFHVSFRQNPFHGGYTVAAGLELVVEYLNDFHFQDDDIEYLRTLSDDQKNPFFSDNFLNFLKTMKFSCDVCAVPEGTVVFPHEPILQIRGPLIQCQLLETQILNLINFHSLIATKAARITHVAKDDQVIELGLRRAQGFDGALSATRAAFIGGCVATSNTLAGKILNIPVRGTHAHSWVMSFDEEEESFFAFAKMFPHNTVFLVDTYNTLNGIKKAIHVGQYLREQGKELMGIRLDSGDVAYLSIEARKLLDDAGFSNTKIMATNDLNEKLIESLKIQGAQIAVWGVGTQLVTGYDQPALGAVYKLGAIRNQTTGEFEHRIKISDQIAKTSTPGILQVRRFYNKNNFVGDMIYDALTPISDEQMIIDPIDQTRFRTMSRDLKFSDLLVQIFEKGHCIYQLPSIFDIQKYAKSQIQSLHHTIQRLENPHFYPAGLEKNLHELKMKFILNAKT